MPQLIVTTALAVRTDLSARAESIASELDALFVERQKRDLPELFRDYSADRGIVVEHGGLALVHVDGSVYRYHPNLGFVRALNLVRGQRDMFAEAAGINPGEKVLDCTVGFGSEALLASLAVGCAGAVVGLESVPELALVTRAGMQERVLVQSKLQDAMRRIEIVGADYGDYLKTLKARRFDLICFDPFFEARTEGSEANINPLLRFGNRAPLDIDSVLVAIERASRRVILKHPAFAELPPELVERRRALVGARRRAVAYSVFDSATADE